MEKTVGACDNGLTYVHAAVRQPKEQYKRAAAHGKFNLFGQNDLWVVGWTDGWMARWIRGEIKGKQKINVVMMDRCETDHK